MRLDPVYLAAPKTTWTRGTSRRAFLLAGGTFFAGVSLGGASSVDANAGSDVAETRAASEPVLRRLQRLSQDGSLAELVDARFELLHFVASDYADDPALWHGIARLGEACLKLPTFPDRIVAAQWIGRRLDAAPAATATHRALAARLHRLR